MLKGFDVSHWQNSNVFETMVNDDKTDFIIQKATEGTGYQDFTFIDRKNELIKRGLLRGYYHYARPERNANPMDELKNFKSTLGNEYYEPGVLLALDWEGEALKCDFDWALKFCRAVYCQTGKHVLIYASASVVRKYKDKYNYWWVAHWNSECSDGCEHDGVKEYCVQYTSKPYDIDIFVGDWNYCTYVNQDVTIVASWLEDKYKYEVIKKPL